MAMCCSSKQSLFLSLILSNIFFLTVSQENNPLYNCSNTGNYTRNSTYERNLVALLSSLPSNIDEYGFYNSFVGTNSDRVYVSAMCRGDVEIDLCREYISNLASGLQGQFCPGYKEAMSWPEKCTLRYSSQPMTGVVTTSPMYAVYIVQDVENGDQFNQVLRSLLESLRDKAASGGSLRKFATGDAPGPDLITIYGLAQCTPDLSEDQCKVCIQATIGYLGQCCSKKTGVKILNPSCNLRYELSPFYDDTTTVVVDAPPPDTGGKIPPPDTGIVVSGKKSNTTRTVTVAVVASLGILVAVICILIFLLRRKKHKKQNDQDVKSGNETSTIESLIYDLATIRNATDDFSDANKLGQGGFGVVYRGKLPSGQEIAVKRLTKTSGHGLEQFKNEVVLMVKLQHRNLVRLIGYCLERTERLLIYEFVINSSLDNFIFDVAKRAQLDWGKRQMIIEGVARGILYLHEDSKLRIIHRDLKAGNILLDAEMNPKIADFGTARLFDMDKTHASTRMIAGTYGYMAPEYVRNGHLSVKIDVFSFGVLILEIVSGKKNNGDRNEERTESLISCAWKSWREGKPRNLIDPILMRGSYPVSEMIRCIHIGLLCVQENATRRPTMASVVLMLGRSSITLLRPSQPAFFVHSGTGADMPLESSSDVLFKAEVSITELHPR